MIQGSFTVSEIELVVEALEHRASRHESYSRHNPRAAGPHDRKAAEMRDLRARLIIFLKKQLTSLKARP